uniref:F0F1 ATP synthase subunit B family protein n=1 Tax=Eshraghiella crossota TaxID=45851 RepID=UPI004026792A
SDNILADARKKAIQKEDEVISEAKEEAGRIIKRADNEIELEKKKAADDMKKEMIAVATMMAGKVVSASIDTDIQESLVDETLNEMGDNTWRN